MRYDVEAEMKDYGRGGYFRTLHVEAESDEEAREKAMKVAGVEGIWSAKICC